MSPLFYHTKASFAESIFSSLGKGRFHAGVFYAHVMKRGTLEGIEVEPQAMPLIAQIAQLNPLDLPSYQVIYAEEGTTKFLVNLGDELHCESVVIPMHTGDTLCISSQVGCKMGCAFCETGRMGLLRNLTIAEIVCQVFIAKHLVKREIKNIVFMGMGEPFDNFDAVVRAIEVLTDEGGLGIGPSRITVSTSGIVDKIDLFKERVNPAVHLAVSVNAPTDEIRRKVMPVNRLFPMEDLKKAMDRFCSGSNREIFIEYVLLKGVNDELHCADQLAQYLEGLQVKVNLIPYNPQSRDRFSPPDRGQIEAFAARMRQHGYLTWVRQTKGQKIMAACGQLGNVRLRWRKRGADTYD